MKKIKLLSSIALALALSTTVATIEPCTAHAGIILVVSGGKSEGLKDAGAITAGAGALTIIVGTIMKFNGFSGGGVMGIGGGILLLDADGSLPKDEITAKLSERYPFIDNLDAIRNLSEKLNDKFNGQREFGNSNVYVSLSPEETRFALQASSITSEQTDQIINDLK